MHVSSKTSSQQKVLSKNCQFKVRRLVQLLHLTNFLFIPARERGDGKSERERERGESERERDSTAAISAKTHLLCVSPESFRHDVGESPSSCGQIDDKHCQKRQASSQFQKQLEEHAQSQETRVLGPHRASEKATDARTELSRELEWSSLGPHVGVHTTRLGLRD